MLIVVSETVLVVEVIALDADVDSYGSRIVWSRIIDVRVSVLTEGRCLVDYYDFLS